MVEICCMFSSISSSRSSLVILNHTAQFLKKALTLPDGVCVREKERDQSANVSLDLGYQFYRIEIYMREWR